MAIKHLFVDSSSVHYSKMHIIICLQWLQFLFDAICRWNLNGRSKDEERMIIGGYLVVQGAPVEKCKKEMDKALKYCSFSQSISKVTLKHILGLPD